MAAEPESKDAAKQVVCGPAIIKAPQMTSWNDDRLDELSARTDEGFKDVKAEFRDVKTEFRDVKTEFKAVRGEIKDLKTEMHDGFARVDGEFKAVRQEMKDGFAQMVTRDEMNERFSGVDKRLSDLTRWVQALVVIGGGAIVGNGIFG